MFGRSTVAANFPLLSLSLNLFTPFFSENAASSENSESLDVPSQRILEACASSSPSFHPELVAEAAAAAAFLDAVATTAAVAGVPDFGMADLARPDPSRTRSALAALVNYSRFREEKRQEWRAMASAGAALAEEEASL